MPYPTITDYNTSEGLHVLLLYVSEVVPIFIPMVLFAIFSIIALGTYFSQERLSRNGGDLPVSFAVAGFTTSVIAIIMTLVAGLINILVVVICIIITVISLLWLFFSKN